MYSPFWKKCGAVAAGAAILAALFLPGCTFLPVKTPKPGSTIVYISPPDSKTKLALYLPDARFRSLVKIEKEIVLQGEKPYVAALRELLSSVPSERTSRLFPEGTTLVSEPTLTQGVLYLNFSRDVQRLRPASEATEMLFLESLVRTLTEHPEVSAVQVLVDGQRAPTLAGHVSIRNPLSRAQFEKKK